MDHKPVDIAGRRYVPQPFLVNTKQEGAFRNVTRIPDDHEIQLAGGEEFVILYVPADQIEPEK